jgi:hypothetical protein
LFTIIFSLISIPAILLGVTGFASFESVIQNPALILDLLHFSWESAYYCLGFMAFELFLLKFVPGKKYIVPDIGTDRTIEITDNKLRCLFITVITNYVLIYYDVMSSRDFFIDKYQEIIIFMVLFVSIVILLSFIKNCLIYCRS